MSRRAFIATILAVVAAHVALFLVIGRLPALPKERYIPPANFGVHEEIYEDKKTGERTIYREIRVSTKLTPRADESNPSGAPAPASSQNPLSHAAHSL